MNKLNSTKELSLLASDINPTQFFHEKIVEAQEKQNLRLTENVEFYLVNLLCDYVRSNNSSAAEDCLALTLKKALESSYGEKICLYKKLADDALYFSGFFQEYFNNKSFDIRYYVTMGESAYGELSSLMRGKSSYNSTMSQIYKEMSKNFLSAVDILLHVSEKTSHQEDERSTLSLYDAWLNTNSAKLQKELFERGINPLKVSTQKVQ
ncbi:MAG: hypothetical protein V4591_08010 [Bdellovibrionota bacterium]